MLQQVRAYVIKATGLGSSEVRASRISDSEISMLLRVLLQAGVRRLEMVGRTYVVWEKQNESSY